MRNRPIVLRNRRQKKKITERNVNLPLFFYQFLRDHNMPNLIWNHKVITDWGQYNCIFI